MKVPEAVAALGVIVVGWLLVRGFDAVTEKLQEGAA